MGRFSLPYFPSPLTNSQLCSFFQLPRTPFPLGPPGNPERPCLTWSPVSEVRKPSKSVPHLCSLLPQTPREQRVVHCECLVNTLKILLSSGPSIQSWKYPLSPLCKCRPLKLHLHGFSGFSHSLDSGDFCYGDAEASVTLFFSPSRPLAGFFTTKRAQGLPRKGTSEHREQPSPDDCCC